MCAEKECSKEGAQPSSVKVASKYVKSPRMSCHICPHPVPKAPVIICPGLMQWDLKYPSLLTRVPSVCSPVWYLAHHLHSEPSNRFLFYSEQTEFFLEPVSSSTTHQFFTTPLTASTSPDHWLSLVLRTFALLEVASSNHFTRLVWQQYPHHQRCSLPPCIICLLSAYNDLISHTSYPLVYSVCPLE